MKRARSKFNISSDTAKRTYDGVVYDSELEMKFYRDFVLPKMGSGAIRECERQVPYELIPKYSHDIYKNGVVVKSENVRATVYVADFVLTWKDGHKEVIDTKGMPDGVAKIKRKLFWNVYPNIDYKWVTCVKKFGGWIDYDECKKLRNAEKRTKKERK